jgi:DNA-directed RNA polymerase specialized sigma24 family protein
VAHGVALRRRARLRDLVDLHDRAPPGGGPGPRRAVGGRPDHKVGIAAVETPYDEVVDEVAGRLERQQVRRCLDDLTDLQRQAVTLAYYQGHSYREVADLLSTPLPTVKTRMRDGLIRLRDCLGVEVATR